MTKPYPTPPHLQPAPLTHTVLHSNNTAHKGYNAAAGPTLKVETGSRSRGRPKVCAQPLHAATAKLPGFMVSSGIPS